MPDVILVDEQDKPVGQMEKIEAHEKGLLHRAFSVMLYRNTPEGVEILLQRRNPEKYHCGGLWTNTCCSHPMPGEKTIDAAQRRLGEEVNIAVPLSHLGRFIYKAEFDNGLTEYELDHVFIGAYTGDMPDFNRDEIIEMKWVRLAVLKEALAQGKLYTPWLEPVVDMVVGGLKND